MAINFDLVASFDDVAGLPVLENPTSLQFGADGRLYVAEQNGSINAFTVEVDNGEYIVTAHEELFLGNGTAVVSSLQNHHDDGTLSDVSDRQVTGLVVAGTADNPVVYVSSSDPRVAFFEDTGLDTNSGIITRLTWNGAEWEAIDLVRGLPRSEENHSINGMVLSEDGTKLYLAVGGNTNNGAPSDFFANTGEYALSGTVLELDLEDLNGREVLTDLQGGQNGTAIEPLVDPRENNAVVDADGIVPLITGQSIPLDVTTGADGTIWVAELGENKINAFAPSTDAAIDNLDFDGDGILNPDDPFLRDRTNGGLAVVTPGETLLWDFDANQDGNLPGANGYGGGLTGVMSDGTNYEVFFQEPSDLTGQIIKLDNVKFNTAAGGGTTVIESVSNGDAFEVENDGEYLFHTGVTIPSTVEKFNIKWSVFNPGTNFTGSFQQIGGYIGTGDQSNYLKIVAIEGAEEKIQILLEDNDVVVAESYIQADDLFTFTSDLQIFFELAIDPVAETATPTVSYETDEGVSIVMGSAIALEGTAVLEAIQGNYAVQNLASGLAVGLFSSNTGQSQDDTFQAIFDNVEITATGNLTTPTILYRVNAGGELIPAVDGGLDWSGDTEEDNSVYLVEPGSNSTVAYPLVEPGESVPATVPNEIFDTERWEIPDGAEMAWAFDVPDAGLYEVRLYAGNGFDDSSEPEERLFDVAVEGDVPASFDEIDLAAQFGHQVGGLLTSTVEVTDGTLNLEFLHGAVENPMLNGIEIMRLDTIPNSPMVTIIGGQTVSEDRGQVQISLLTSDLVPSGETVEATIEIVPNTATALEDYSYSSPTAIYDADTGIYTEEITIPGGSADATLAIDLIADAIAEDNEAFTVNVSSINLEGAVSTDSISVTIAGESPDATILYRVNAGGSEIAATDGEIPWSADTAENNSLYLNDPGSNSIISFPAVTAGDTVPQTVSEEIFDTERWDLPTETEMQWGFEVEESGLYQVRLYIGNGFADTSTAGERVFDVALEDNIPAEFDNIDPSALFGHEVGGVVSSNVEVTDGILNLEFLHGAAENPMVNGIEIAYLETAPDISKVAVVEDLGL